MVFIHLFILYSFVVSHSYMVMAVWNTFVTSSRTITLIMYNRITFQFSSVQSLFATPWITARQASLSITSSWSSLILMSIKSVMPASHLILCCPLLLLPPIPPSIRLFSNESTLRMRWPQYWSFSLSIGPSKETPGLVSFTAQVWTKTVSLRPLHLYWRVQKWIWLKERQMRQMQIL